MAPKHFCLKCVRWWRRVTSIANETRTTTSNFAPSADPARKRRQIGFMRTPVPGTEFLGVRSLCLSGIGAQGIVTCVR